jgi:oxygen-independent coproporphyrinogen-3 oxidase
VPLSVYVHIPFCTSRCAYCDFNTYAGLAALMPTYVDAVREELRMVGRALGRAAVVRQDEAHVHTVYFGGGTPSLLPPDSIEAILETGRTAFDLADDAEITLEANPATLGRQDLARLRRAGINRLSLGAQSANPDDLRLLEREHTFDDVVQAVRMARRAGFHNLSLDLIYGLPGQPLERWVESLQRTVALSPEHLSLYALSLEYGTPLRSWVDRGLVVSPDPDQAAEMYEAASLLLAEAGFVQYEISNWARQGDDQEAELPTFACRHNIQYWHNGPYLGMGAGAHGFALGWRYSNVLSPPGYIDRIRGRREVEAPCSSAVAERIAIGVVDEMDETMMLGFRLTREGIRPSRFRARFGSEPETRYGPRLRRLEADGLIERGPDVLRLTERGRLLGNRVFGSFV